MGDTLVVPDALAAFLGRYPQPAWVLPARSLAETFDTSSTSSPSFAEKDASYSLDNLCEPIWCNQALSRLREMGDEQVYHDGDGSSTGPVPLLRFLQESDAPRFLRALNEVLSGRSPSQGPTDPLRNIKLKIDRKAWLEPGLEPSLDIIITHMSLPSPSPTGSPKVSGKRSPVITPQVGAEDLLVLTTIGNNLPKYGAAVTLENITAHLSEAGEDKPLEEASGSGSLPSDRRPVAQPDSPTGEMPAGSTTVQSSTAHPSERQSQEFPSSSLTTPNLTSLNEMTVDRPFQPFISHRQKSAASLSYTREGFKPSSMPAWFLVERNLSTTHRTRGSSVGLTDITERVRASIGASPDSKDAAEVERREDENFEEEEDFEDALGGTLDSDANESPLIDPELGVQHDFLELIRGTGEMGNLIADYPWHTTPVGPIDQWIPELRTLVAMILVSPFRLAIWYGRDLVIIYNDAYRQTAGKKHPKLLGKMGREGWAELWPALGETADRVCRGHVAFEYDGVLFMDRDPNNPNGIRKEETYHTWSWSPLLINGEFSGFYNPSFETTNRVLTERRMNTLRDLGTLTSFAKSRSEYCKTAVQALAPNAYDIPFAIMYTCTPVNGSSRGNANPKESPGPGAEHGRASATPLGTGTSDLNSSASSSSNLVNEQRSGNGGSGGSGATGSGVSVMLKLTLAGSLGVPEGHPSAKKEMLLRVFRDGSRPTGGGGSATNGSMDVGDSSSLFEVDPPVWPLQEACSQRKPIYMPQLGSRVDGFELRGWDDPVTAGLVLPVTTEGEEPSAVLIVGLNPRLPWNETYATFYSVLTRSMSSGLNTAKSFEEEIKKANELEALDRAKTSFFNNITHELRTPLTLILGPLDDLLRDKEAVNPSGRDRLKVVLRNGKRLLSLVNSLLDLSKFEAGRLIATYRPVDLCTLTSQLSALFRSAIERAKLQYTVTCELNSPIRVWTDPDLWERVVFNIVSNAFKYTMAGEIRVSAAVNGSQFTFTVTDTGCGIPDDQLSLIFDRFHRVESVGRSREGTGIGLALTIETVRLLGGKLTVASKLDKGSTFTVTLPLGKDHLPLDRLNEEELVFDPTHHHPPSHKGLPSSLVEQADQWAAYTEDASSSSGSSGANLSDPDKTWEEDLMGIKGSRIVVVDDNADMCVYVRSLLKKHNFKVDTYTNSREALRAALRESPDLVISDVLMPDLDGHSLLRELRASSSTAQVPMLLVSAHDAPFQGMLLGAEDQMMKPFEAKELLARVQRLLVSSRTRQELDRQVLERTRLLHESEEKNRGLANQYFAITNYSPVGIFTSLDSGEVNFANPRWYDITGHSVDDPLSMWEDDLHPNDRDRISKAYWQCVNQKSSMVAEFRWRNEKWCQFDMRFTSSLSSATFIGSLVDVTARKEAEHKHLQAVEQRAADAEASKRESEMFVDVTSHEMRNPLSAIWQNAELVSLALQRLSDLWAAVRGQVDARILADTSAELEQSADAIESILICVSHQGRIADDILNVSKLNLGLLTMQKISFNLVAHTKDVLRIFESEAQSKTMSLSLNITQLEGDSLWIIADPNRLAQVLINFLTNAVRFTAEASSRSIIVHLTASPLFPKQSVSSARRVGMVQPLPEDPAIVWVTIGVEDSGRGLSHEDLVKLFERFSQAQPRTDQVYGGAGLGLFVSRSLIEAHGGFVEVKSEKGQGSVFSFSIPAEKVAVEDQRDARHNLPMLPARPKLKQLLESDASYHITTLSRPTSASPERRNAHILVVEDNLVNQKVLVKQLRMHKYSTTVANHGQEALDILLKDNGTAATQQDHGPIDLVLMDVQMPVKDGLTAIKELRAMEASGQINRRYAVVAITGNARPAQIEMFLTAGFDEVAIKPYKLDQVLAIIKRLLDTQRT